MSWNADKSLHSNPYCCVDWDGEEDLGDGEEGGDHMGEGVQGVGGGQDRHGEHHVGQDDAEGVRHQQQWQHVAEDWLQL